MEPLNKQQVIIIHGGDTFDEYDQYLSFLKEWKIDFGKFRSGIKGWKDNLETDLGSGVEVVIPAMPNKMNAKYLEWKIWFEKFIPYFKPNVILVGHSLGGLFLVKFLSENQIPQIIKALFLVAPPFNAQNADYSLADFILSDNFNGLQNIASVFIYQSEDDPVVPFDDLAKYQKNLPKAISKTFTDRGHFSQEHFPELVSDIKSLLKFL